MIKILNLITKSFLSITKKISLIILANPNSPTGTIIDHQIMLRILKKTEKLNIPLVIDEAYAGFYKRSYIKFINKFNNNNNKNFSKSFGLASLRAGYAVGSSQNIKIMNQTYVKLIQYRVYYRIFTKECFVS